MADLRLYSTPVSAFLPAGRIFYLYVPSVLKQKVPDGALQKARMVARSAEGSLFIIDSSLH